MFYLLDVQAKTSLSPEQLDPNKNADELLLKTLRQSLEGVVLEDIGLVVAVISCRVKGEGLIPPRSPDIFFNTEIELVCFRPLEGEILEGEIVNVTETGAFVNIGSLDGFWPRNRISNKRLRFNVKRGTLEDRDSEVVVKRKDKVRVEVNTVEIRTPNSLSSMLKETRPLVTPPSTKNPIRIQFEGRDKGTGFIKELQKKRMEILKEIGVT